LPQGYEFTKEYLTKNYKIDIEKNESSQKSFKFTQKPTPKHLSLQEHLLSSLDKGSLTKELEELYTILKNSSSYEEALLEIEKFDNPQLEKELERYIFANGVLSELE